MRVLESLLGRTGRQRGGNTARTVLEVECLETRELLTASPSLIGTVLTVNGSNGNDRIEVFRDLTTDQLVVQNGDQVTGRFASAGVTQIVVNTFNGNDFVFIGPNVVQNTIVNGGTGFQRFRTGGDVVLYQGLGQVVINGGNGDNQEIGSTNLNTLNGGAGFNFFYNGGGPTTITEGSPRNLYTGNLFTTNVTDPMPNDLDFRSSPPLNLLASPTLGLPPSPTQVLTKSDVDIILQRATAATPSQDGVMAIVDRTGRILGVRIEAQTQAYLNSLPNDPANPRPGERTFMTTFFIDGAVAEARTAAFLANNQAPLTSRTFQTTSQTTITQREIESYPSITDPNSRIRGPGFVAPLGLKDHFPEDTAFTPQVDQFAIEHTNRDSIYAVNTDNIRGGNNGQNQGNDIRLLERFNENPAFIPASITTPGATIDPFGRAITQSTITSYGEASGFLPGATPRGLGTLPGGIPIYKEDPNNPAGPKVMVGAIGTFFPGKTGFADEENSALDSNFDPSKPDRSLEAEYIGFVAAGGSSAANLAAAGPIGNAPALPIDTTPGSPNFGKSQFDLPAGRIDLVGITLNVFGPKGNNGPTILSNYGKALGTGVVNGALQPLIDPGPNNLIDTFANNPATGQPILAGDDVGLTTLLNGTPEPEGWLVNPHASQDGLISTFDVQKAIFDGVQQALITRAAIRLPMDSNAVMVLTVTDRNGEVLGQFRMPDSTIFSIDVSTAKARNAAYYANAQALQPQDALPGVPPGAALTARTFRYLALPRFPEGIDGNPPGPWSQLNDDPGIDRTTHVVVEQPRVPQEVVKDFVGTGLQIGPPAPASQFQSPLGFDSFNPGTNFHDIRNNGSIAPGNPLTFDNPLLNRDGVVFFPGSLPLYKGIGLVGGFGVSGDGVDQDDEVTAAGGSTLPVPDALRADQFFFADVRLPFQKFNRQPNINPYGSANLGSPLDMRQ
jgi:uncharacterized protein GlcG (DUF336 family)